MIKKNGVRYTREIKSCIAMARAAFNGKKTLCTNKIGRIFKEETSKMRHLDGVEKWVLRKIERKYLERLKIWH
jgi:hypothetical protein